MRRRLKQWEQARGVLFCGTGAESGVALTIDDSPDPDWTVKIGAYLAGEGAPATFFIAGDHVAQAPDTLNALAVGGHSLGNHLMRDEPAVRLSPAAFERDLLACDRLIRPYGPPRLFRPPSGWFTPAMVATAARHGYRTVLGDAFPLDTHIYWQPGRRWLLRRLTRPGSIVILHDRGARGARTDQTLRWLVPWIRDRGWAILPLDRILPLQDPPAAR